MKMDNNFLTYSALDSACMMEIHDGFWDELGEYRKAYDMTMNIMPALMFMQSRGVKIDRAALDETKLEVIASQKEKQEELDAICGRHLNVNSPADCQKYFYGELGIPPYKGKTGNPTVDDMALQRLVRGTAARPGLRQAKLVQEIRGLAKLYGTYLDLEFDTDGRMRCSYNPRGTKFGRLSSSKTIFGTGTNFQNLPGEFKKFLVPDDGYCFMEVDKRQAEWVVVAYCSGDASMINAVESGVDIHSYTAHLMFDVPFDVIKAEHKLNGHTTNADLVLEHRRAAPEILESYSRARTPWPRSMSLRQCGKKSNHGLNYGEGYYQFALLNEIDQSEAKRIIEMYHRLYPGINIWYESVQRQLRATRTLTNCFGRTVRFLDAWGESLFKSAYSMIPQSTVVDSLNGGMQSIHDDITLCGMVGANADLLAQVHDSILLQVPIAWLRIKENFGYFREKIRDYTSPTLCYNGREFKIASDYKFGLNWGEFHKEKNPKGMQEFEDFDSFTKALEGWEKLNGSGAERVA